MHTHLHLLNKNKNNKNTTKIVEKIIRTHCLFSSVTVELCPLHDTMGLPCSHLCPVHPGGH